VRPPTTRPSAPVLEATQGIHLSAAAPSRRRTCVPLTPVDLELSVKLGLTGQEQTGLSVPVQQASEEILLFLALEESASMTANAPWIRLALTTTVDLLVRMHVDRTQNVRLGIMEPSALAHLDL